MGGGTRGKGSLRDQQHLSIIGYNTGYPSALLGMLIALKM